MLRSIAAQQPRIRMAAFACLALSSLTCLACLACERSRSDDDAVATHQLTGAVLERSASDEVVAHFPDEARLARIPATLGPAATRVRKSPGGETLAVAPGGTDVIELAHAREHYLVALTDPAHPARSLEGWIYKDALENWGPPDELASTGTKAPECAKSDIHVQTDRDFCAKPCHEDGDCRGTGVCDGDARTVGLGRSEHVRYCIVAGDAIAQ